MANIDQSYLIELDSNLSPTILMKQTLERLESQPIRRAARVLRLNEPPEAPQGEEGGEEHTGEEEHEHEEEEAEPEQDVYIDPVESEETLLSLMGKRRLAPGFKWRRSKCSYICPVSLRDLGRIRSGRGEFAASFLDKVYMMADEASLRKFLKNPRPYLRAPQPRAPCKVSILGPKYAGKTSLSGFLAKRYNARVIDMHALIEPQLAKAKEELVERTKQEATDAAVEQIKIKFREKIEQEKSNFEFFVYDNRFL